MPGSATAEILFIGAMMILILIIAIASVYFFMRQYKKEMRAKAEAVKKQVVVDTNGNDIDAAS